MPDLYTKCCVLLPYKTLEQKAWAASRVAELSEIEITEEKACPNNLILTSEYCDIEELGQAVSEYQLYFHITEPWYCLFCIDSSRPVVNTYSGIGLLVYKGEVDIFTLEDIIADKIVRLDDAQP